MAARIGIAGAGIGGLAAAVALRRAGFEAEVFERAPELRPVGAGIVMQTNAMLALRRIGLDAAVEAAGGCLERSEIRAADGRVLQGIDVGRVAREAGAPVIAIHRARLQQVLLGALGGAGPRLGAAAAGFDATPEGVTLELAGGGAEKLDALIGADGLRSAVRAALFGDGEPAYAGYTSWRGICRNPGVVPAGFACEIWGAGRRFGLADVGHGEIYWFATRSEPAGGRDAAGRALEGLLGLFGGWASPVPELLRATAEGAVVRTDIADRPFRTDWGRGRVTLLGDAAHPMTPNLGQGGCQAVEDAVVLAERLARTPGLEAGLRAYERDRAGRARFFVEQSRRIGRIAQASGFVTRRLRDLGMRLVPVSAAEKQMRAAFAFEG